MKTAPWIIISVLIILLVLQRECHRCPDVTEPVAKTDTVYIPGDPYPVSYPVYVPVRYDSIVYDTSLREVDSFAIVKDYLAEVYGHAVLIDDSSAFLKINYMVCENRLKYVIPIFQNKRATTIIHNTTVIESVKPKTKIFAGVGVGRSLTSFALAPSLALLSKKDHLYTMSYDVINNDVYVSMYWKLHFRKK
jgi:hypothetical protein